MRKKLGAKALVAGGHVRLIGASAIKKAGRKTSLHGRPRPRCAALSTIWGGAIGLVSSAAWIKNEVWIK